MPFHEVDLPNYVYRVSWGDDPLRLPEMRYIQERPGRFDDPDLRYRVLYTADKMAGAFVEVLASLRANKSNYDDLAAIGGEPDDLSPMEQAIDEYLEPRSASLLIAPRAAFVDVVHPESRSMVEEALKLTGLKSGDFLASDITLPRRASRVLYEANANGIAAPSAEAAGAQVQVYTYNFFEDGTLTGELRATLVPRSIDEALNERIAIDEAVDMLGLLK